MTEVVKLVSSTSTRNASAVGVLEAALDRARKGDVTGVIVQLDTLDGHEISWYGVETRLLGLAARAVHAINRSIDTILGK